MTGISVSAAGVITGASFETFTVNPIASDEVQGLYVRESAGGGFQALAVDPTYDRVWGASSYGISYIPYVDGQRSTRVDVCARPSSQSGVNMVFDGDYVYLVTSGNASKQGQVWRSPVPGESASFTWTLIFDLTGFTTTDAENVDGAVNSYFREGSFAVSGQEACIVEYGSTLVGGTNVYLTQNCHVSRSSMLWTKTKTFENAKHGHSVTRVGTKWWVMIGDTGSDDIGLWSSGDGVTWAKRSVHGESGNPFYGINLYPVTILGAPVMLTEADNLHGHSVLCYPSQEATGSFPLTPVVDADWPYNLGTVFALAYTTEGNLMWFQTGENGAVGPQDSFWISCPPFRSAVLLEAVPSNNSLGSMFHAVEIHDDVYFGGWRIVKEKFVGQ